MQQHPAELAAAWFAQAIDDVESADVLFASERFATCCFLCQQSAEKALEALLHLRCGDVPRTRAIADLARELATIDPTEAARFREATALDPFFVSTRYPDAIGGAIPAASFHRAEAELALSRARRVIEDVRGLMPRPNDG